MELKVLEKGKDNLKLEIIGEDHTLCNALRAELNNDKSVEVVGYNIEHPLTSHPVLILKTNNSDPFKAVQNAVKRLKKKNKELAGLFKKI